MLIGAYHDVVTDCEGIPKTSYPWRHNLIVSSAWVLVAALLRNEASVRGLLFCAVGEGDAAWDAAPALPVPAATHLRSETTRVALGQDAIDYLDATGRTVQAPTHRLALAVTIEAAGAPRRLREFGLFGGNATTSADSGLLFNYAIHPLIELQAGQTLTRRIRLSFRPGGADPLLAEPADVPQHWLSDEPVTAVDGVGAAVAEALQDGAVSNVGQLALLDATRPPEGVTVARAVEYQAKARLALQAAAHLDQVPELDDQTIDDILAGEMAGSVSADTLHRLRAQLGLLQVALDARLLRRLTVRDMREGPS